MRLSPKFLPFYFGRIKVGTDEIHKIDGIEFEPLSKEERTALFSTRPRPFKIEFIRPEQKDEYFMLRCYDEGDLGFTLAGVHVHEVGRGCCKKLLTKNR